MVPIGAAIRKRRRAVGFRLFELSLLSGIGEPRLRWIELLGRPSDYELTVIADALLVEVGDLKRGR